MASAKDESIPDNTDHRIRLSSSRKFRVLVVDDDDASLDLASLFLSSLDVILDCCNDSTKVQALFAEKNYDLLISDIRMPDIDGLQLCSMIKSDPRTMNCCIIIMSGLEKDAVFEEAFELGAMDYIIKPVKKRDLLVRAKAALRMKASLDEVSRSHAEMQAALFEMKMKRNQMAEALNDLTEVQKTVLFSMAKLAENRDNETGRHLLRVQSYVELLAKHMQKSPAYQNRITDTFIEKLVLSAPLHDIGKVGIPDSILLKPGKLTETEFEVMKQHTVIGAQTLVDAAQQLKNRGFLDQAIEIAQSHHEKNDGSGYPKGLRGEEIPISARIMMLADNYDAIRSRRVYKDAYDHPTSVSIILGRGEEFFHKDVLEAFVACASSFYKVSAELEDD